MSTVGGHQVFPVHSTAGRYIAAEWTTEIRRFASGSGVDFRSLFLFFGMSGSTGSVGRFAAQMVNARTTAPDEAYGNLGNFLVPAHNFGWTAEGTVVNRKEGLSRNELSGQWKRFFNNGDGAGHTWPAFSRTSDTQIPVSIDWKIRVVGFVTDPKGHLYRPWDTGVWTDLTGDFAVWNVRCAYLGTEYDIGNFYLESNVSSYLPTSPYGIDGEFFYDPNALSAAPVEVVFSGLRIYDQQNGWWTEFTDFQIQGDNDPTDTDQGVNATNETGKLTVHCGIGQTNEVTIGKYILQGLVYERGDTGASLPLVDSSATVAAGAQTYVGPLWGVAPATYPFVQQEVDRGHYVLYPADTSPAVCVFTAPFAGTYRLTGDFCRADSIPVGAGVTVSIVQGATTLFSGTINNAIVDGSNIFNNAGIVNYDVSTSLARGETVRFVATGTGTEAVDATGFRLLPPTYQKTDPVEPSGKSSPLYAPPDTIFTNLVDGSYGPRYRKRLHGLRHRVFFFDDADDAEIWNTIPNGTVAIAVGQSESDANADVMAFLNSENQLEFDSTAGNNRLWVHTFEHASLPSGTSGTNAPPTASGSGFVPARTGMFTNDLTLAGDNLANGRIVGFGAFRHRILPFEGLVNGDIWNGPAGIVSTAFQNLYKGSFVKTRITARTLRTTTVQFSTTSQHMVNGWLHYWSR